GVEMGDDHATDRLAVQLGGEDLLPRLARRCEARASIHDRPRAVVLDEPQVDVVELEGQRHAQPLDTRRDRERPARPGRWGPGMNERVNRVIVHLASRRPGAIPARKRRRRSGGAMSTTQDLCWLSAADLAAAIRRKKVSPREVVDAVLARIEKTRILNA